MNLVFSMQNKIRVIKINKYRTLITAATSVSSSLIPNSYIFSYLTNHQHQHNIDMNYK